MSTRPTNEQSAGHFVEIPARNAPRGTIASWPRPYAENPYLRRLADALADHGVSTRSHRYLAALVASPGNARWLHLHWPEWMLTDASPVRRRARALWLFALIDAAIARGLRLAWTAHNLVGHDDPHPELARAERRRLLARCDVVFGHFASAEDSVRALGFSRRFVLAPHPNYAADYPPPPPRHEARAALGYGPGETVLLALGAIEPYKGLDRLAAAFARRAPANTRLLVAGRASDAAVLTSLRRAAAGDARIRIEPGFVDAARVATMLAAADAAVIAYRECFTSGAAVLALTFGVPLVATPVHHLAEMAGEPFFITLPSVDDLGDAVRRLDGLDDTARARGRTYALERTWARTAGIIADALFPPEARP